jgi:hypothetical protein
MKPYLFRLSFLLAIFVLTPAPTWAATDAQSPEISAADLQAQVSFLASDECDGRLTGTPGVTRAANFIAASFQRAGLKPIGKDGTWFMPFEFVSGVRKAEGRNTLAINRADGGGGFEPATPGADFEVLTFSGDGKVESSIVFAGYGLVEPEGSNEAYNSYKYIDVSGKTVLVLSDLPEDITPERRQQLALYAGTRYKAKIAADLGAVAFLVVTGPNSPYAGELPKFNETDRTSAVPIPATAISIALADRLLAASGTDIKTLQTMLDGGEINPHAESKLAGIQLQVEIAIDHVNSTCRNVVAAIPPIGGCEEYVLVGAHYDHIGHGAGLGSMARPGEENQIHNGADDNASGTSVVMELAAALAAERHGADESKPQRGVIFACWSGEELGLIGSGRYAADPAVPLDKTVAYFNFDMVGRLKDNKLVVQSVGSSPLWRGLIERRNVPAGFNLSLQDDPYLPTDATTFYTNGVPALSFFTDLHQDYNRPTDDPDTLNYEGMERIAKLARQLIVDAMDPAKDVEYTLVKRAKTESRGGGRRAYTGTVPDMATGGIKGVRLSAVSAGSPAEKAGLAGGDIIVSFAGKEINNLQDYSDALTGAKIGEPVEITVEREGKRLTLSITPDVRK